jgi:hypothetical protein
MTDNVIKFPVVSKRPQTNEDVAALLQDVQDNHIAGTASVVLGNTLQDFQIAGFDFIGDEEDGAGTPYEEDIKVILEAYRSILHRYYGRGHFFQDLSLEHDENGDPIFVRKTVNDDDTPDEPDSPETEQV